MDQEGSIMSDKIEKQTSTLKKLSKSRKAVTYIFLVLLGATMVIPFLWMVSTAFKNQDQATKPNWIPTSNYIKYNSGLVEIVKQFKSTSKPGLYRLRFLDGPSKGDEIDTFTNYLTPSVMSENKFSLAVQNKDAESRVYNVALVKKLKPLYYDVVIKNPVMPEENLNLSVPENEIITKFDPEYKNFPKAIEAAGNFVRSYINSIAVAIIVTVGHVFTCSLAAYAFARLKFPGRDILFLGYLATMMIPSAVTMIPVFVILKMIPELLNSIFGTTFFTSSIFVQFGVNAQKFYAGKPIGLDSYFALVAPSLFGAYGTFMLRQFFLGLPEDLEDAAKIDGCSLFRVYTNVILPLSKPALATLTILTFMGAWRNFLWPLVVTSTPAMQTLPVMLQTFQMVTRTQYNLLMACNLMVMLPMIIVFCTGQRFFIEGIRLGAVKG